MPLTQRQYDALALHYGAAEAPLKDTSSCSECRIEAALLAERRKREKDGIVAVDTLKLENESQCWYLMSEWWLARWRAFINNDGHSDGTGRGILPPGPIDNARLLDKAGKPLKNLRATTHYRGVNSNVWQFLTRIYGGGPELRRKEIDIYSPSIPVPGTATAAAVAALAGGAAAPSKSVQTAAPAVVAEGSAGEAEQ